MPAVRESALAVAVGVPALFVLLAILLNALAPASGAQPEAAVPDPMATPLVEESLMPIPDPVELGGPDTGSDAAGDSSMGMADPAGEDAMRAIGEVDRPASKAGKVPVSYSVKTSDPVAFITIDDGVHRPDDALAYVRSQQLPVTAFLTTWTVGSNATYFTDMTEWGSIQNHTVSHASFDKSSTNLSTEICKAQRILRKDFGSRPWMLRPPYGAGADRTDVKRTAQSCGINQIVMWDASVNRGKVVKARGDLLPGSIVLLHFRPELKSDLEATVRAIREAGLRPANLADYLTRPA